MFNSLKKSDGGYTVGAFCRRALSLVGFSELKRYFDDVTPDIGFFTKIIRSLDYYGCLIRYGATVCDYFEYEFWKKSACARKEYITKLYGIKIQKHFNTGPVQVLTDKLKFNETFKHFRNLPYFTFDKSEEDFLSFVHLCRNAIMAKPITGFSGIGIFKPDVSTEEKARAVYRQFKTNGDFFCEEAFCQTGILGAIHPFAVNTIRFYTLNTGGTIHEMFAAVRFGGSKEPVDNIHAGGMSCEVDIESGVVIGKGYNLKGDVFVRHPLSGHVLPGVQIPLWQQVRKMVAEAAAMCPEIGYIGWDVAVSEEKIALIEGNECANVDLPQTCGQRGLKKLYRQYMH
jgi:hypothetical protein